MKLKDIPQKITEFINFITRDIWRALPQELTKKRRRGYNVLKVITLAIRRFVSDNLQRNAAALTYSTFLALVPLLAVLFSIAKGFDFESIVKSQLFQYFPVQGDALTTIMDAVNESLQYAKGGLFLGLGILLLLYTVYSLVANIENTFNRIWQVPAGRPIWRRLTDYFSAFLLIPIFMVASSGISILFATTFGTLKEYELLAPIYEILIAIVPILLSVIAFTALYMFLPNTKVQFKHALIGGLFAAIGFQAFQYLYINGQIWVTKYNAIYGGFAFVPLLLLWMQLSWTICLIGAQIAYAGQHVQDFEFEEESNNISRRYLDFITLSITSVVVKRFHEEKPAYTAIEISQKYRIPIRLTRRVLNKLVELDVFTEVKDRDTFSTYQPAIDINLITLEYLFTRIDLDGLENFKVDNKERFRPQWEAVLQSRIDMFKENKDFLVKDL